jgi:hypothetical protein
VCLPFVLLKLPVRERERREREVRMEKPSPNGRGISNCPQLCGGLETLEYDIPPQSQRKNGERELRVREGMVRERATSFNVVHPPRRDMNPVPQGACGSS